MLLKIKDGEKWRPIGSIDHDNRRYEKLVRSSKHLFRVLDAFGIDAELFTTTLEPLDYGIFIHDKDEGVTYTTSSATFSQYGVYKEFKPHRKQIFLPRKHFSIKLKRNGHPKTN